MSLNEIRDRISIIDSKMAELFVERMKAAGEVAEYKMERGLPIEDLVRERSLIEEKSALIEDEEIRALYIRFLQNTMDISKSRQYRLMKGLRIACAGENGSPHHAAAGAIFPDANLISYNGFEEAYRSAETGECDIAVLPLENSYDGEVGKVYDLIFAGNLFVNDVCAVNSEGSTTRYAVLSVVNNEFSSGSEREVLLIMFTVKDEAGELVKALNIISAYDYNMRVMRSRPMKDLPWHYYFYAELEGSAAHDGGQQIKRALSAACPIVKLAGHYPEGRHLPAGGPHDE